jgi:hypothetical protein
MSDPIVFCDICGRSRDPFKHMRQDKLSPPEAARRWLKRKCDNPSDKCNPQYRAGVDVSGLRAALIRKRDSE